MRSVSITAIISLLALGLASQATMAQQAGDIYVRASFEKADLDGDELSSNNNAHFAAGFLVHDKVGVELGIGDKVEHDYALGNGYAGKLDRMPTTLLLQYYPLGGLEAARVQPFLGLGVNYTRFSGVSTQGADSLNVKNDYGIVGQVGVDLRLIDQLYATGYARYSDIDAKFKNGGQTVDKVRLDPLTVGAGISYRF